MILAEDDADDLELFQDALAELPFLVRVSHCQNGNELMQYLRDKHAGELPDIVFLDLNMPQKTGLECVQEIKRENRFRHVSIVILSTSADSRIVKQLYQQGADRYLFKPTNFADLKSLINRVLNLRFETRLRCTSDNDFVLQP